ncbi:LPXTG cell wall anchor domain-containing protein [Streptococcus iners]|uniref:LPXTG cell wall anchor domain-containing protein n=1 Tax=Streptococcus iners TaxID=3028084 RepID=A0AA96VLL7_9STRE|nr:LPXTG cell wall anchor domain-containing protein [Streptococcus sp. 29887]MCK4025857.1 LPXTG cell wall anchor domain-containing protein [Streptococcus suis]WNY52042.1 LPXTG cell wall anchor domain-containing protein [Streptococcus sp. 29887]
MGLKTENTTVRKVQNSNAVLSKLAEKTVYSHVEGTKTLPSTGQTNSSILQMFGLGLASIGLVVKRKKH